MTNAYYNASGNPAPGADGLSALLRAEFVAIQAGFSLAPQFLTTGLYTTTFNQQGTFTFTLPPSAGTLATTANVATETTRATAAEGAEVTRATAAEALLAPKASPALTGTPTAPTATGGTNTTQLATTAFVQAATGALTSGVSSVNTRTGAVTLSLSDITGAAPLASPTLTGTPAAPTAAPGTNTTQLATTAFVQAADTLLAPLASPTLTGVPVAPTVAATAAAGTTQLATTAFVRNGTTTNDNALSGQVGEYIASTVLVGSAVSLITGTAATVTSISLTAGDWDVQGNVAFSGGGSTVTTTVVAAINTTAATLPTSPGSGAYGQMNTGGTAGANNTVQAGMVRMSLATTTTVYLIADANFTTSTLSAYGFIGARRMR